VLNLVFAHPHFGIMSCARPSVFPVLLILLAALVIECVVGALIFLLQYLSLPTGIHWLPGMQMIVTQRVALIIGPIL